MSKVKIYLGLIVIILVVIILVIIGCTNKKGTNELETYENKELGFMFDHYSNWQKQPLVKDNVIVFAPPLENAGDYATQIIIIVGSTEMNLQEYTKLNKDAIMQNIPDSTILSEKESILAENPANEITYTGYSEAKQRKIKTKAIFTVKDSKSYFIQYAAELSKFDKNLEVAQTMIDSFKII